MNSVKTAQKVTTNLSRVAWLLLLWPALVVTVWAWDRTPPFELLSYTPIVLKQGDPIQLQAKVKRDQTRKCSVLFSRYVVDSYGQRSNETAGVFLNSKGLMDMASKMGSDTLKLAYPLLSPVRLGNATFVTVLDWKCNPLHTLWPIQQVMEVPFVMMPINADLLERPATRD